MGFGQAFSTCMRKYVNFTGRARRSEYWWFYLAICLIMTPFAIAFLIAFIPAAEDLINLLEDGQTPTAQMFIDNVDWDQLVGPVLLFGGVWLIFVLPNLAVTARRLHDIGLTGWLMLVSLVPYVGGAALIVMCVIDSQARENRWGPDPKADERQLWGQVREAPPPLGG
jgi:uncharacterized membrane protein YhaH (DUF805 family)